MPAQDNVNFPPGLYIGDYQDLEAIGNIFHGTFSASNDPDPAHFPVGAFFQRNVNVGGNVMHDFTLTARGTLPPDAMGNPVPISIDPYYFAIGATPAQRTGAVSFSVDGGALNSARLVPNPAEGLENVVHAIGPNDVYVLGTAPPNAGAPGGHGLPTEGEIFVSGTHSFDVDPDGTNVDRLSGALGNVPRIGPHAPVPAPSPATGNGVFGLVSNDNVDALSYGLDSGEVLYFSVDPATVGVPGTDVFFHSILSPGPVPVPIGEPRPVNPGGGDPGNEAAGDVYASQLFNPFGSYRALHFAFGKTAPLIAPPGSNLLLYDERELGLQAPAVNGSAIAPPEDDLDALELADPTDPIWGVDFNMNGVLEPGERPVRFSLDLFSPSLGLLTMPFGGPIPLFTPSLDPTVSADDILETPPFGFGNFGEDINGNGLLDPGEDLNGNGILDPFIFGIYASGILDIGLRPGDDLDALVLSDEGRFGFLDPTIDEALFSLAPGAPTLLACGRSPADVFYTNFLPVPCPLLYAQHDELGLLFTDNLNALDIRPIPEPAAFVLLGTGLAGLFVLLHRRKA